VTQRSDDVTSRIRKAIFDRLVEHGTPPVTEELMTEFGLSRGEAGDVLHRLEAARHISLVPRTERILMAFPFSAVTTPFRVTVANRTWFANCAWDAIAFHAMLASAIRVDSYCHHCGVPITVEMAGGRANLVDPSGTIVYLAVPAARWWDDIVTTCGNTMVFFASAEHRDASDLYASVRGASLTPDETYALSLPIYERKLASDYARPSKEELVAHFARLGLAGDFWQL
jgi:hypothetical protein